MRASRKWLTRERTLTLTSGATQMTFERRQSSTSSHPRPDGSQGWASSGRGRRRPPHERSWPFEPSQKRQDNRRPAQATA